MQRDQNVCSSIVQGVVARLLRDTEVLKFTFGTPGSVPRAGCVKATVKDGVAPEEGYRFGSADGLLAYDRGGSEIVRPRDEYTPSVYGAYRVTPYLTCAPIEEQSDNALLVPSRTVVEKLLTSLAAPGEFEPAIFSISSVKNVGQVAG